jgi:hypothetical protein
MLSTVGVNFGFAYVLRIAFRLRTTGAAICAAGAARAPVTWACLRGHSADIVLISIPSPADTLATEQDSAGLLFALWEQRLLTTKFNYIRTPAPNSERQRRIGSG